MFIVQVGRLANAANGFSGRPRAYANSAKRSSATRRMAAVYSLTNGCNLGTSAGHTLGANQIRSTSGSPVAVSAPRL